MAGTAAIVGAVAAVGGAAASADSSRRQANASQDAARNAADRADPAAGRRPFFQDWLMSNWDRLSSTNTTDIMRDPSFQFQQEMGMRDILGAASASGGLRSGTLLEDMSKFNQGLASTYVDKQFARNMALMGQLGNFSGLNTGQPGVAGQLMAQGGMNQAAYLNNMWQQIGGGINMYNRWAQGGSTGQATPTSELPNGLDYAGGPAYG